MSVYRNITTQRFTEIKVLLGGLKLVVDCSIVPTEIELDSIEAIEALENFQPIYMRKINHSRLLMKRLGNPSIRHSFRQANKVADFLSRPGTKLTPSDQATILSAPPYDTMSLVKDDQQRAIYTKLVLRTTCNKLAGFDNLTVLANYGNNAEAEMPKNLVSL